MQSHSKATFQPFHLHHDWESDDTAASPGCSSRNWPLSSPSEPLQIKDVDKTYKDNRKHIFGQWVCFLVRLKDCSRYFGSFPGILPHSLLLNRTLFPSPVVQFGTGLSQSTYPTPCPQWLFQSWACDWIRGEGRLGGLGERSFSWHWLFSWGYKKRFHLRVKTSVYQPLLHIKVGWQGEKKLVRNDVAKSVDWTLPKALHTFALEIHRPVSSSQG